MFNNVNIIWEYLGVQLLHLSIHDTIETTLIRTAMTQKRSVQNRRFLRSCLTHISVYWLAFKVQNKNIFRIWRSELQAPWIPQLLYHTCIKGIQVVCISLHKITKSTWYFKQPIQKSEKLYKALASKQKLRSTRKSNFILTISSISKMCISP